MTKNLVAKLAIVAAIGLLGQGIVKSQCVGCAGGSTPVFTQSNVVGSYNTSMAYATPVNYGHFGMTYTSGVGCGTYTSAVNNRGGYVAHQVQPRYQSNCGTYTAMTCRPISNCVSQNRCCAPQNCCGNSNRLLGNRRMNGYQNCCIGTPVMTNACGNVCGSVVGCQPAMGGCAGCATGVVTPVMGGEGEIVTPPVAEEDDATPPVPETGSSETATEAGADAEGDT